jgi:hypothetical protein
MKGGGDYQLPRLRRRYVGVEMGVGDKAVGVSVGSGIVPINSKEGEIDE